MAERLRFPEIREVPMLDPATPIVRRVRSVDPARNGHHYELPDDIECNIPRRPQPGEGAAWNAARGNLIETCRATGGRPVGLLYIDLPTTDPRGWTVRVATTLRLPQGEHVTAIATARRVIGPGGSDQLWSIHVNGVHIAHEDRIEAPAPSIVGQIVRRALIDTPSPPRSRLGPSLRPERPRHRQIAPRPPAVSPAGLHTPEAGR
ncbi:hypothetical protein [Pseudonocardia sp. GCM10023141]|uniref:hypothetical protein n=1 Tax=Pseudonocardia sp. GCM10023141 TaxID=3252653 RepID=UPI00360BBA2A